MFVNDIIPKNLVISNSGDGSVFVEDVSIDNAELARSFVVPIGEEIKKGDFLDALLQFGPPTPDETKEFESSYSGYVSSPSGLLEQKYKNSIGVWSDSGPTKGCFIAEYYNAQNATPAMMDGRFKAMGNRLVEGYASATINFVSGHSGERLKFSVPVIFVFLRSSRPECSGI